MPDRAGLRHKRPLAPEKFLAGGLCPGSTHPPCVTLNESSPGAMVSFCHGDRCPPMTLAMSCLRFCDIRTPSSKTNKQKNVRNIGHQEGPALVSPGSEPPASSLGQEGLVQVHSRPALLCPALCPGTQSLPGPDQAGTASQAGFCLGTASGKLWQETVCVVILHGSRPAPQRFLQGPGVGIQRGTGDGSPHIQLRLLGGNSSNFLV